MQPETSCAFDHANIVVKKFTHESEVIPWDAIRDGALNFNAHVPATYVDKRLEVVKSRVLNNGLEVIAAFDGEAYVGHMFFAKQRSNLIRVGLCGLIVKDKNVEQEVFTTLFKELHTMDGHRDLICAAPFDMVEGFQAFLDRYNFKPDNAIAPSAEEIAQTFEDYHAATYKWFRRSR